MNRVANVFISRLNQFFIKDLKTDQLLTYREFFIKSYNLSKYLISIGVKKKEKIIVISGNSLFKVIFFFSSIFNNYHLIILDDYEKEKNLKKIIKKFNIKFFFIEKKYLSIFKKKRINGDYFIIKNNLKKNEKKIFEIKNFNENKILNLNSEIKKINFNIKIPYLTILTSGTTGIPKGIIHNLESLFNSAINFNKFNKINYKCVMAHFFSMSYMAGILNTIFSPFLAGGKIILFERFNALSGLSFWQKAIKNKVNYFWASPTMLNMIIKLNRFQKVKYYTKNYLKKIFIGTAQFPKDQKKFSKKIYYNKVLESYGTTEDLFITCEKINNKMDSSGKLLPNVKVKIFDKKKIMIKSNSMHFGSYNIEKRKIILNNKKKWRDTGDLGELLNNNYLNIIGRDKDIIIKGGKNIYPIIIENLLYNNKNIKQVAAVGLKNKLYGEEIAIFYNTYNKVNKKKFENKLMQLCDKQLNKNYRPDRFIYKNYLDQTKTGKIKKNTLKLL